MIINDCVQDRFQEALSTSPPSQASPSSPPSPPPSHPPSHPPLIPDYRIPLIIITLDQDGFLWITLPGVLFISTACSMTNLTTGISLSFFFIILSFFLSFIFFSFLSLLFLLLLTWSAGGNQIKKRWFPDSAITGSLSKSLLIFFLFLKMVSLLRLVLGQQRLYFYSVFLHLFLLKEWKKSKKNRYSSGRWYHFAYIILYECNEE